MTTRNNKARARALQNHVREQVIQATGIPADQIRCALMSETGVDLKINPLFQHLLPVSIECKATTRPLTLQDLEQARKNASPGTIPAVVRKPKGARYDQSTITFDLNEFLNFYGGNQ